MQASEQGGGQSVPDANAVPAPRLPLRQIVFHGLHPLLFAAASVLGLYASNLHELYVADVMPALAAALGVALLLYAGFGVACGGLGPKPAVLASIVVVASLFYAEIIYAANRYLGSDLTLDSGLAIILAITAILLLAVALLRVDLTSLSGALTCGALVFFIAPLWQIVSHEWRAGAGPGASFHSGAQASAEDAIPLGDGPPAKDKPDIYYFIFDRYGSQATLADYYGFDNGELIDFLKAKGFYVAADSRANYLKTAHSVASTFHMDYLDFLREDQRSKIGDWHPIFDRLKDHRVGHFLKSNGYTFIQLGAWWGPTHYSPSAQENYSFGFRDFNYWYVRRTILPPLLGTMVPASTIAKRLQWGDGQCERVPHQIEKVKEIGKRPEPTFVFTHILVPHDPYVFNAEGRCLSREESKKRTERDAYIAQVRYANSLIKDAVNDLLDTQGLKPIIIIQADEGPFPPRYRNTNRSWHDATVHELKIKTGILNAYYFPDGDYRMLDQHISPVNSFRMLFNKYFGTRLERLPDRVVAFPDYFSIYDFYDITDVVDGGRRK